MEHEIAELSQKPNVRNFDIFTSKMVFERESFKAFLAIFIYVTLKTDFHS